MFWNVLSVLWMFTTRGLLGPDPEHKVTVNGLIWNLVLITVRIILVNMENFKLLAFLLLEIWRHNNFLSRVKPVIAIRYLSPGIEQNLRKITFYTWKHLSWHKFIPSSAFLWFWSETKKFVCSIFRDISFQKQIQQPWWIDFAKILPKCVLGKNKKSPVWRC